MYWHYTTLLTESNLNYAGGYQTLYSHEINETIPLKPHK